MKPLAVVVILSLMLIASASAELSFEDALPLPPHADPEAGWAWLMRWQQQQLREAIQELATVLRALRQALEPQVWL